MGPARSTNRRATIAALHEAYSGRAGTAPSVDGVDGPDGAGEAVIDLGLAHPQVLAVLGTALRDVTARPGVEDVLLATLGGAMGLVSAELGTLQLLDPLTGSMRVVTSAGLTPAFVSHVDDDPAWPLSVPAPDGDRAQRVVADVAVGLALETDRQVAREAGFRAVQATPFVGPDGRSLGIVSTYSRRPGTPTDLALHTLSVFARFASRAISRSLSEAPDPWSEGPAAEPPAEQLGSTALHVMSRLFGASVELEGVRTLLGPGEASDRLADVVEDLDHTLAVVRHLGVSSAPARDGTAAD